MESTLFSQEVIAQGKPSKSTANNTQSSPQEAQQKLKVALLIDLLSRLQPDTLRLSAGVFSYLVVNTMVVDQTCSSGEQDGCPQDTIDSVRKGVDTFFTGNLVFLHFLYSCDIISCDFL